MYKPKVNPRFLNHLKSKGKIPDGPMPNKLAFGGEVHDEDEWEDDSWNDHTDTSGEPSYYMNKGGACYSDGGEVVKEEEGRGTWHNGEKSFDQLDAQDKKYYGNPEAYNYYDMKSRLAKALIRKRK